MTTGEAMWSEDLLLPLLHRGTAEAHYFTFSFSPIRDESGQVCGVFCPVTETTERVDREQREHVLRRQAEAARAQLSATLESITDAFYTLDRQWRFTYANQRAKELWGRPHHDFVGTNVWEEFPESEHMMFGEQVRKAMTGQVTAACEGWCPPMGMGVALRAYPSAEGVAVYFQDMTARKQMEEALQCYGSGCRT